MKADFVMGIHFHQPVGNFDYVIEHACDKCYMPFLETLKKYPDIKMSFHFTGCLLEWIEANRPEIIDIVRDMTRKGQIEMLSGGFYEPILTSIPERDRLSQIAMLNDYVRSKFKYEPKGAWVAERVWEPTLPAVFHDSGIKYVILDDTHFLYSGITKDRTYGYYITEDNGKTVAAFPSDKVLRYHIPFKMPEESINYMKEVASKHENPTFIYGDDGEKFGEWPGTHKWVYEEKWLKNFFDEIIKNKDWLNTITFSECLDKKSSLGRVYFPTTSYEEMLEWSLPPGSQEWFEDVLEDIKNSGKEDYYKPFIRGGFWRNFFAKYPESNHMNKKMLYVSNKLNELKDKRGVNQDLLKEAERELFRGQCNCAYWHGVFGGLYLFHLRRAIFNHLIKSETLMDKAAYGVKPYFKSRELDIDADGQDEVLLENRDISLYFDPAEGGVLKEFDSKGMCQNFLYTLRRRKEAYHRKIIEKLENAQNEQESDCQTIHDGIQKVDPGIGENLIYDRYNRYGLIDHFIGKDVNIESFFSCKYNELGDFVSGHYKMDVKKGRDDIVLSMGRKGNVEGLPVSVVKRIGFPLEGSHFSVNYTIKNMGDRFLDCVFAPEFNFTMPDADAEKYSLRTSDNNRSPLSAAAEDEETQEVSISDNEEETLTITFSEGCRLWYFPVRTVSQSEKAYELNYQGSSLLPSFELHLQPNEKKDININVRLG